MPHSDTGLLATVRIERSMCQLWWLCQYSIKDVFVNV